MDFERQAPVARSRVHKSRQQLIYMLSRKYTENDIIACIRSWIEQGIANALNPMILRKHP